MARSAFTQRRYSALLLPGIGPRDGLLYLVPPLLLSTATNHADPAALMTAAYLPTMRYYRRPAGVA